MIDGHHIEPEDPRITAALRALLAPPDDAAYWSALEATMLARLAEDEDWTAPFARWTGAGLIAAALAALITGAALVRTHDVEAREMATLLETPISYTARVATEVTEPDGREATLRYVIEP
ncbi:MAG TPA: hypothetical protein VFQ66_06890 [Candidatus Limnocylindria bacterium]|jgi:hypothetical protein|nr:hypothetical protein [Candidatus Limnocylindria bacterium]